MCNLYWGQWVQVDSIYTDFGKVFKIMRYSLHFNIIDPLLRWFEEYLRKRIQYVKCKKIVFAKIKILGVLQGFHLETSLFNVLINDVSSSEWNWVLFVYRLHHTRMWGTLLDGLVVLSKWSSDIDLELNPAKYRTITLSRARVFGRNLYVF